MRTFLLVAGVISLAVGVQVLPVLGAADYVVRSHDHTLELSLRGQIVGVLLGKEKIRWNIHGQTELDRCRVEGPVRSEKGQDGAVRFKKKLPCDAE